MKSRKNHTDRFKENRRNVMRKKKKKMTRNKLFVKNVIGCSKDCGGV